MATGEQSGELCSTADQIWLSDVQRVGCAQGAEPTGVAQQLRHEGRGRARRSNTRLALQQGLEPMVGADCTRAISRIGVQLYQRPMS
jgi:hypothetical protein